MEKGLWILAIADSGCISHTSAHNTEIKAIYRLTSYLKEFCDYDGEADMDDILLWYEEHNESLSFKINYQNIDE